MSSKSETVEYTGICACGCEFTHDNKMWKLCDKHITSVTKLVDKDNCQLTIDEGWYKE